MAGKKTLFIALLAITLLQVKVIVRAQVALTTPTPNQVNLEEIGNDGWESNLLEDTEGESGSGFGDDEDSEVSEVSEVSEASEDNKEDDSSKRDEQQQKSEELDFEGIIEYHSETTVNINPPLGATTMKGSLVTNAAVDEGVLTLTTVPTTTSKQEVCKDCPEGKQEGVKGELETCGKVLQNIEGLSVLLERISEQGIEGPAGLKGSKGAMGEKGTPGSVMYKGQKGDKGDSIPGARGIMGPIGPPGMPGARGDRGPTGPQGIDGHKGESIVGPPGRPGEKGECIMKKIPGPPGLPGRAGINIQVFDTVSEMNKMEKLTAPGSLAYVRETGKFYGRTTLGWATLLMYQLRHPRGNFKEAKTDHSASQTKRPKQLAAQPRQKQDGDGRDGKSQVYNNDPPVMTSTTVRSTTEQAFKILNQTLLQTSTQLRLISLNSPWSGNMNGIDFINYQCQREAMDSNLGGIFRAFLSTTGVDLTSLIHNKNDKIVNLHNHTLYGSKRDLFRTGTKFLEDKLKLVDGKSSLYSFDGQHVILDDKWDINLLWHGALMGGRHSRQNCQDWKTNSSVSVGIASDFLSKYVLDQQLESCSSRLIVLCIELSPLVFQEYLDTRPLEFVGQQKAATTDADEPSPSFFIGEDEYKQFLKAYYEP